MREIHGTACASDGRPIPAQPATGRLLSSLAGVTVDVDAAARAGAIAEKFGLLVATDARIYRTFGHRLILVSELELARIARVEFRDHELPAGNATSPTDRAIAAKRIVKWMRAVLWQGIWGSAE